MNVQKGFPPAYSSKPDPDQPWRYVCPDCGGQVHSANQTGRFYECDRSGCHRTHHADELEDKKTGQRGVIDV